MPRRHAPSLHGFEVNMHGCPPEYLLPAAYFPDDSQQGTQIKPALKQTLGFALSQHSPQGCRFSTSRAGATLTGRDCSLHLTDDRSPATRNVTYRRFVWSRCSSSTGHKQVTHITATTECLGVRRRGVMLVMMSPKVKTAISTSECVGLP